MTFTQLEIFARVAELGGFTAAADKLGISQSAVSHAIKQLEKSWGVSLLSRTSAGIELTDIGMGLLVRVRELLGVTESIHQEVTAVRGLQKGVLRIGSFGTTSSLQLLPLILKEFKTRYPGIDVFVDESEDNVMHQWISERRVDVGFVVLPDERFDTIRLIDDQFVALIPQSHLLAEKKSVRLAELCSSPFILTLAGSETLIEGLFKSAGLQPDIRQRYKQILTIVKMVESGSGVSIVADLGVSEQLMSMHPGVVKRPLLPAIKRSVGLAVQSEKHASPAVKAFLTLSKHMTRKHRI